MSGLQIAVIVAFTIAGLLGLVGFVYAVRGVPSAFRAWWEAMSGPQITATDEELLALRPEWPLKTRRWPTPMPLEGDRMSKVRCLAYARLAGARARSFRYSAEALIVLMAAILGLQLSALVRTWGDIVAARDVGLSELWIYLGIMGVAIGIAASLALRAHSEDLEVARSYYQQAARVSSRTVLEPPEQTPAGRSALLRFFFR